jgi:hypothetical protein
MALLAAAVVIVHAIIACRVGIPTRDAAEFVQLPARALRGDIPYRDFLMFYPPGYLVLPGLLAWVFGGQIVAVALASRVLEGVMIGLAVWFWTPGRRALPAAYLALALTALGFGDETLLVWLAILAVPGLLLRASATGSLAAAGGVGLLAGIAGTVRMEQTPGLLAASVFALVLWNRRSLGWRKLLCWTAVALGAALIPWGLCILWIAAHGALPQMVYHLTTLVRRHVAAIWVPPFWLAFFPPNPVRVIPKVVGFCAPVILLAWGIAAQVAWNRRHRQVDQSYQLLFTFWLLFGALLASRLSIHGDLMHLLTSSVALYVSGAWTVDTSWRMGGRWRLATVVLGGMVLLTPAAVLAERLSGLPGLLEARRTFEAVDSPVARGMLAPPEQAEAVNAVLRFLREHAAPGEPIFVADFGAPAYYVLSGHPNGTRYDSLLPGFMTEAEEAELVNRLRAGPVRFVIGREDWGLDRLPQRDFSRFAPRLHKYMITECHPVLQVGDQVIWERNAPSGAR